MNKDSTVVVPWNGMISSHHFDIEGELRSYAQFPVKCLLFVSQMFYYTLRSLSVIA